MRETYAPMATTPTYHCTTTVNDEVIGQFRKPIEDPFVHQTVTIGWRGVFLALFRRQLVIKVTVGADRETEERVMELNPDYLGDSNSPSRKAWNAQMQSSLSRFASE